jgi:hypothetical protein
MLSSTSRILRSVNFLPLGPTAPVWFSPLRNTLRSLRSKRSAGLASQFLCAFGLPREEGIKAFIRAEFPVGPK